jgi:uncharacterized protein (DUF58 family)
MDYSSAGYFPNGDWPTKRERAELILVALASLLVRGGERLSLLGTGMLPVSGRIALSRIVDAIDKERGATPARQPGLPKIEPLPRAAQLVLIGDFLGPLDAANRAVTGFAALGLSGHLLQIVDPAEEDLPFDGRVRFEGVADADTVIISRTENIRADYRERLRRHREGLSAIARAVGWTIGFHRTDRPPHLALLALYTALSADRRR